MRRALLALPVLLLGCSTQSFDGFPDRALDTATRVEQLKTQVEQDQIDEYDDPTTSPAEKRRLRNQIINAHIALIDINFTEYLKNLHQVGVGLNLGTSAATIGLGAAGALVSGGTSQILSGTSAAVTGFKESIDKEAFFEQTMPALVTKMIAERQRALVVIRRGLARSIDEYPLTQGLGDIESYYYAGTIPGALAGVANDAGATLEEAREEIKRIPFELDPPAERLSEAICPGGECSEIDPQLLATMRDCWPAAGVPETTLVLDFVLEPEFARQRAAVAECMGL